MLALMASYKSMLSNVNNCYSNYLGLKHYYNEPNPTQLNF